MKHESERQLAKAAQETTRDRHRRGRRLPAEFLEKARRRLAAVCLLYAITFFLANFFMVLVLGRIRQDMSEFADWAPGVISISVALAIFGLTRIRRIPTRELLLLGLVFEVAGSFGIAFAEYWGFYDEVPVRAVELDFFGLSWVAVWVISYTVVVPNRPRYSLLAALVSGTSVPITIQLSIHHGGSLFEISPELFFAGAVFPYVVTSIMAYAIARIMFALGVDLRRAREMGSYQLKELIGLGGMGEVWRAEHRMLARPAAIKLIRPDQITSGDASTTLRRFEQEARATAALRSPHTIVLYDFGLSDEGAFYYVMELLDGFDLESFVSRHGPQSPARTIHFLRQACHSLHEAHEAGLIHRDIKPANLFLCRYGSDFDFLKVLDFGLVAGPTHGDTELTKLTQQGLIIGSPAFMAPEMAVSGAKVDGRADLYAIGCVAYWLLTGSLVFEAPSALNAIIRHARDIPTPPSIRSEFEIPRELDAIVLACLEKDPRQRPGSALELSERLESVDLSDAWTPERSSRWWQLHAPVAAQRV